MKNLLGLLGFLAAILLAWFFIPKAASIILMLGLLSFLVIAHELGHFAVARWVGIKVERFGFGLPIGPTLYERKVGDVTVCIHLALLGGYVSFPDDNEDSDIPMDSPVRFENKPAWARIAVVVAGVTVNAILAYLLMFFVMGTQGFPSGSTIKHFLTPSTAQAAGLKLNDTILGINGKQILPYEWDKFGQEVKEAKGKTFDVIIYRDKKVLHFPMKALPSGLIGVELEATMAFVPILEPKDVILKSNDYLLTTVTMNFTALGKLFTGQISPKMLSGPVGIVKQGSEAIAKYGFAEGLFIAAILSMILAVMNLLPIPMLDGGHLLFIILELLRGGKPIPKKFQEVLVKTFFFILIGLMVLLVGHDINTHILGN